jgi:2-methylcitrate dehydratase PrpD
MTQAAQTLSARIAGFVLELELGAIPVNVQRLARLHIADALGVGLASSSVSAFGGFARELRRSAPLAGPATVLGAPDGTEPSMAALINGTLMHSLEYDDTHMASIVHGSAVIVPAALAAGEAAGLSLDAIVALVAAGWEALVRIGAASQGGFQRRGFQVTSVGGVLIAALLAARARGLDRRTSIDAMGIAGSQAGGIFEFLSNGSTVKALHPGWAAHSGFWAAACAAAGMTGPATVLEGRFGLFNTYAGDAQSGARLAVGLDTLGTQWMLEEAAFKFHPCCHYIHSYVESARELVAQAGGVDAVDTVHCRVAPGMAPVICEPWDGKQNVRNGTEAKHSLPYCVALAMLGLPIDVTSMTAESVDARATALAQRIEWSPYEESRFPARFDAAMSVTLKDGRVLHHVIDDVFGSATRQASEGDVRAKFVGNASRALDPKRVDDVWQAVLQGGALADLQRALRG